MIIGVGIDIIEVERVAEKILKGQGFCENVFSKREIDFCEQKGANKAQHYAARFSAKEAFLKATGMGLLLSHELNEIEVTVTPDGKPNISLAGNLSPLTKEKKWNIHLSLSHINSIACAMVVIESYE